MNLFACSKNRLFSRGQKHQNTQAFRGDYNEIGCLRAVIPNAVMVAMTATAAPEIVEATKTSLNISDCQTLRITPNKSNIK